MLGFEVELPREEAASCISRVMVLSGHFDLPARSAVLEQVSYNGHDSCCYCTESKDTYGEHVDKVNYVEMKHVSELAIIGLLLKPFKTWVVPGKLTVILTRTRGGMLAIELVRFMDLLPCQGIYM